MRKWMKPARVMPTRATLGSRLVQYQPRAAA